MTICPVGDWTEAVSAGVGAGPAVVAALANATQEAEAVYVEEREREREKTKEISYRPYSYSYADIDEMQADSYGPVDDGFANTLQNRSLLMTGSGIRPSDQFYEVVSQSQIRLSTATQPQLTLPAVRIDGPYGAPSEDVFRSDLAVLVGAGIGVTPFASILKHIWYRQRAGRLGRLKHVEFIWVCRDAKSFAWFNSVLREIEDAQVDRRFTIIIVSNLSLISQFRSKLLANKHVYHAKAIHGPALQHCYQRFRNHWGGL